MTIGRFLKSLVSPKAMAEEIIGLQEQAYRAAAQLYPDADPHVLLAQAWLSRVAARGSANPADPHVQQQAFSQTWQCSIIPWPGNVRALGLLVLYEERPELLQALPEYRREFDALLSPGVELMSSGAFFARYEQINPHLSYSASKETGTGWLFAPKEDSNTIYVNADHAEPLTLVGSRRALQLMGGLLPTLLLIAKDEGWRGGKHLFDGPALKLLSVGIRLDDQDAASLATVLRGSLAKRGTSTQARELKPVLDFIEFCFEGGFEIEA